MPFPISGSSSGTTLTSATITQAAHGFVIGDALYWNGTAYVKANADNVSTSEVIGIVSTIPSVNTFTLATAGLLTGLTGLTSGEVYWLSDVTSGLATTTQPTAVGSVTKPLFVATSATTAQLQIFDTAPALGNASIVQYGENPSITDAQTTTSTSFVDVTNSSFTLPSAGTWEVEYNIFTNTPGAGNYITFQITDSSNTAVTSSFATNGNPVANVPIVTTNKSYITTTGSATYKLRWRSQSGSSATLHNSVLNGNSKITWKQIGASPVPMDLVGEYGENNAIVNGATFGTSLVDITGSSFTLPTAGTWDVEYAIFGANNTPSNGTVAVYDASNVLVPNSTSNVGIQGSNGLVSVQTTQKVTITTTSAATYKLRGQTAAGAITVANLSTLGINSSGNSKITWRKISGFLPSSGQTVAYVFADTSNNPAFSVAGDLIFNRINSGNVPLNISTGVFTLTAGKTYELESALYHSGATNGYISYQWVDNTNVAIPGSQLAFNFTSNFTNTDGSQPIAKTIFTPSSDMQVKLRIITVVGGTAIIQNTRSYAKIVQLGSSAVIAGVYSSVFTNYTPTIGITSGVAPVLPTSAVVQGSYTIQGKTMLLNLKYFAASVTGGSDGSGGSYSFSIPAGYVIDTTKAIPPSVLTNTGGSGLDAVSVSIGSGYGRNSTGGNSSGLAVFALSSTTIGAYFEAQTRLIGPGALAMTGASNTLITMSCQIPLV